MGLSWLRVDRTLERRADVSLSVAVLDSLPVPRALSGPDGTAIAANRPWYAQTGVAGGGPFAFLDALAACDAPLAESIARLRKAARTGIAVGIDLPAAAGNGRAPHRRVSVAPVAGALGYALWSIEEVPDATDAEDDAPNRADQLNRFFDDTLGGYFSVDGDGRLIDVNTTLAAWLGTSRAELCALNRALHEFLLPSEAGAPLPRLAGEEGRIEATLLGADGHRRQVALLWWPVRDNAGRIVRRIGAIRDLTAARPNPDALARLEARARRFFDLAPVGIALLDSKGVVTECNPAFATMVGVATLAGRALRDILAAEDADALGAWLDRALAAPEPPPPIEVFAGAERETVLSLVCGRIEGAGEAAPGLILHALNLSETKKLETRFLQAQKMEVVGKLAGGIAHDFNNLLTAMIGFCDLVLLRHSPKDQSYADIMQIKQNANRAASLVRQLLAFSRQQTLQPRVINVTDVLAELSHLLRRLIGANIELRLIHGRDLGTVKVDQTQFGQVITNLAVNARDAMPEGGTLTIRTSNLAAGDAKLAAHGIDDGRDFVAIEAIDTGHGIAKEHLPKIFEPFFTTKDVGQGTGLGLSTVYGIIEQTGGHVLVDSHPGEGATFTILLPRHQPSGVAEAVPTEAKDADARRDLTGTGTVLLVEDEDAVRLFGARALRNKGYQVIEAKNGEAALEVLSQGTQAVDILVTDVVMPGMDGPMLVRHVREKFPDLKVVFMSGYTEDSFRQRLDKDMAIHFLPKPFNLQQLAARVKEVLQGKPN